MKETITSEKKVKVAKGAGTKNDPVVFNGVDEIKEIISEQTSGIIDSAESHIRILKGKIKDGNFLEAEYEMTESIKNRKGEVEYKSITHHSIKSKRYIHFDLAEAFKKLNPHLPLLCEIVVLSKEQAEIMADSFEDGSVYQMGIFKKYSCTGFSIGGNDEHEGITLIGRKSLRNKRVLNLVSPFQKFEAAEHEEPYEYEYHLNIAMSRVVEEIKLFIDGKCAINPQLSMFEGEEDQGQKDNKEQE